MVEKLRENDNIRLYKEKSGVTAQELREKYPDKKLVATDFRLIDAHTGKKIPEGFIYENIVNIDHHSP